MNRATLLSTIGSATVASVLAGGAYIIDCRAAGGEVERCWLTGLPIAGLGATGGGAFQLGYETLNPKLRSRREDDAPPGARRIPTDPDHG
jgi:hypothetical protein